MKAKKYFDVFGDAARHPKAEKFAREVRARIALAEAIHRERIKSNCLLPESILQSPAAPLN